MAYYDLIRIYGLPDNEQEQFQGLGAAALYNAEKDQPVSGGAPATQDEGGTGTGSNPIDGESPPSEIPADLWTAQGNLITQQNAYLDDIKDTFTTIREQLNVGFTMQQFTESNAFKFMADLAVKKLTDWITDAWPGLADDAILDTISTYAPKAMGWGLVWLHKQLLAGGILCERMKEENLQLLNLSSSFDGYKLRSDIISQHDLTVQSLLAQVALVETQLQKGDSGLSGLTETLSGALYGKYDPKFGTTLGWKYQAGLTEHLNKALFFKDKEGANEDIGLATLVKELLDAKQTSSEAESNDVVIQCPHTGDFIFSHSRGKMSKV